MCLAIFFGACLYFSGILDEYKIKCLICHFYRSTETIIDGFAKIPDQRHRMC